MARRDLSQKDASAHAASELEYIIHKKDTAQKAEVSTVTPEQAMTEERVYQVSSNRDVTRVVFISQNKDLLNPAQQSLDGYVHLSELFDEVHIVILRQGIPSKNPVLRVADNVWIYTVSARLWWRTPAAALRMLDEQLVFVTGFRPDLIVAHDPFESAIVAYKAGAKYGRATQLHILDDYTTADFLKKSKHNFWRRFFPRYTIPHFVSVRTQTSTLETLVQRNFQIPDVAVLPKFQNYESIIERQTELDLKKKYPAWSFVMLFAGKLTHESTAYRALDAARFVLKNPRVGMIVLGDGPSKSEFIKRTKILGIEKQVVFDSQVSDIVPYLKSASLLIVSDINGDSEELVLKAAAAGIPMVMSRTQKREDIFTHGESAFLCDQTDVQAFTDRIDDLLNDIGLRKQFAIAGQAIIREHFHSDPEAYREAYRASIEQAFFVESEQESTTKDTENIQ